MPFTAVIFAWRKAGTSPAEFKDHYENHHMALVKSLAGDKFPLTHTRHYIQRTPTEAASADKTNAAHPPVVFVGQPDDYSYDSFAELVFEDATKFQEFMAVVQAPEAAAKLKEDEEKFLDRAKMTAAAVDQVSVTSRYAER